MTLLHLFKAVRKEELAYGAYTLNNVTCLLLKHDVNFRSKILLELRHCLLRD